MLLTRQDPADEGPMGRINTDFLRCSWETHLGVAPSETSPEYWEPYRALVEDIYEEIRVLREGRSTVLLVIDMYPAAGDWVSAGIADECLRWWEAWQDQNEQAALANGAVMVSVFDLFHGPDHDQDPLDRGLVTAPTGPNVPYRTTEAGARVIADALLAAGLEPTAP